MQTLKPFQTSLKKNKFAVIKSENFKDKNSYKAHFIRDFKVKLTKRENIDKKKLLRTFRKFLKEKLRRGALNLETMNVNIGFWKDFINENILPPFKYYDQECGKIFEFKSFNTNYIVWLLSHKGSVDLYEIFIREFASKMMKIFKENYKLEDGEELEQLDFYIKNLTNIFHTAIERDKQERTREKKKPFESTI